MKKNKQTFFLVLASLLLLSNCATSSKNFRLKDVKDGEAVILGNIKIMIDGEDFTKHCYVGFNGNNKPYVSLDSTGNIITGAKEGKTQLTYITCIDTGLLTVTHSCNWTGAEFTNVGNGKQTYFGNITVNWEPSNKGGKKALALLGGLGGGLAAGIESCGKHEVTVASADHSALDKIYKDADPEHLNVQSSIITPPKK